MLLDFGLIGEKVKMCVRVEREQTTQQERKVRVIVCYGRPEADWLITAKGTLRQKVTKGNFTPYDARYLMGWRR